MESGVRPVTKSIKTASGAGKKFAKGAAGIFFMGFRLLQAIAILGFIVLAVSGGSYHGHKRPRELAVAAVISSTFFYAIELLFWVVRKIKEPPE